MMIQAGHVAFPDDKTAAVIADYIGSKIDFDPSAGPVPASVTAKIAESLIDAQNALKSRYPNVKFASTAMKIASEDDLNKFAHATALAVMEKAAEGSTIEGDDKGNREPTTGEGKMDLSRRPEGYATDSLGKTDVDTRPGAVGKETPNPLAPPRTDHKDNSIVDQSKTSSLAARLNKLAEGTTILGGDKGNTEATTGEGKMDLQQRPEGYALLPSQGALGELMNAFGPGSHVGKEAPQPVMPSRTDHKDNSVIETTKKTSAEDPFLAVFNKTAAEVVPFLPNALDEDAKVAHVRVCMGLTTEERANYLIGLQQKVAAATVSSVPPGSRSDGYGKHTPDATHSRQGAYDGRRGNQGTKQAEEHHLPPFMVGKEEKNKAEKDEEKPKDDEDKKKGKMEGGESGDKPEAKEASLAERMQHLRSVVRASSPTA
jgi:hypothetical protein